MIYKCGKCGAEGKIDGKIFTYTNDVFCLHCESTVYTDTKQEFDDNN